MAKLTQLSQHIKDNNPDLFLTTYLHLLNEDYSLTVPQSTRIGDLQKEWEAIIARIPPHLLTHLHQPFHKNGWRQYDNLKALRTMHSFQI